MHRSFAKVCACFMDFGKTSNLIEQMDEPSCTTGPMFVSVVIPGRLVAMSPKKVIVSQEMEGQKGTSNTIKIRPSWIIPRGQDNFDKNPNSFICAAFHGQVTR